MAINVSWKDTKLVHVSAHRLNQILDVLENKLGYTEIKLEGNHRFITTYAKLWHHYFVNSRTKYDVTVYVYLVTDKIFCPIRYTTRRNRIEDTNNVSGKEAFMRINNLVKKESGKSIPQIFGSDPGSSYYKLIKRCVPAQISYADPQCIDMVLSHCFKGDVSSAFPYEASKPLPTLRGAIEVPGEADPSADYPFAFCIKRGIVKSLYDRLDTSYFYERPEYKYREAAEDPDIPDVTILCKSIADHPLKSVFMSLYTSRKKHPEYKSWMNLFIGYCQLNSSPQFSPIPAIVISRCNDRMFKLCDELKKRGDVPRLVNTDSVLWTGNDEPDLMETQKYFGSFTAEHSDILAIISGPKKYQLQDKDGMCRTTYAGVDRTVSSAMEFGEAREDDTPETIFFWDTSCNRLRYLLRDQYFNETIGDII